MQGPFLEMVEREFASGAKGPPEWESLRQEAKDRFLQSGLPTNEQETWRFTNLEALTSVPFESAARLPLPIPTSPDGALVMSLSEASLEEGERVRRHLGRYASLDESPFAALNTTLFKDGLLIVVPAGMKLQKPIEIRWWSLPSDRPSASYPRTLMILEAGSRAHLVESFSGQGSYLTNAVTEVYLGEGASLEHYKIQEEDRRAFHIGQVAVWQDRDSRFVSHLISTGGRLARNELRTTLAAEGSECTLNGLYWVQDQQHVDNQTSIDHVRPHGTSREIYKGILDGQASAVFNGRIIVRPHAAKSNARQSNKNLLLSKDARVNTKPLLEILNNDVKCNHGATIGQLDENQIFYLRSRGLTADQARRLLVQAFANELVSRMALENLREQVQRRLPRLEEETP